MATDPGLPRLRAPSPAPHVVWVGQVGEVKLTERAQTVMALAESEAVRLGDNELSTTHILRGIILEGEGIAAGVLESLVQPEKVIRALDFIEGRRND